MTGWKTCKNCSKSVPSCTKQCKHCGFVITATTRKKSPPRVRAGHVAVEMDILTGLFEQISYTKQEVSNRSKSKKINGLEREINIILKNNGYRSKRRKKGSRYNPAELRSGEYVHQPNGHNRFPDFLVNTNGKLYNIESKTTEKSVAPRWNGGPPQPDTSNIYVFSCKRYNRTVVQTGDSLISKTHYSRLRFWDNVFKFMAKCVNKTLLKNSSFHLAPRFDVIDRGHYFSDATLPSSAVSPTIEQVSTANCEAKINEDNRGELLGGFEVVCG